MAWIHLARRWNQQPPTDPELDLSHPLLIGLIGGYTSTPASCLRWGTDLLRRQPATSNAGINTLPSIATGRHGGRFGPTYLRQWSSSTPSIRLALSETLPTGHSATVFALLLPEGSITGSSRTSIIQGSFPTPGIEEGDGTNAVWQAIGRTAATVTAAGATAYELGRMDAVCSVWRNGTGLYLYVNGAEDAFTANVNNSSQQPGVLNAAAANANVTEPALTLAWKRALDPSEIEELSRAPWQIFRQRTPRFHFFVSSGADLTVDIDTAGSVTIEGQEVALSLGVALNAGAVTIEGQSATLALGVDLDAGAINIAGQEAAVTVGVNLDEAGSILIEGQDATIEVGANLAVTIDTPGAITVQGQSVTVALGVDLANAGQINIEGQSATLALGLNVDEAGSIIIGGEEVSAVVSGDLDIPIEVAGSIVIEGQECDITLSVTPPMEGGRPARRRPSRIRPEELPAFKVDIDFLQPWQECRATVEVSDEFDFEFFQDGALANLTAEAITEVEIDARQEVAELMATLSAVPMRGVAVRSMPRVETARVSVSVSQAPAELSLLVSVE